MTLLPTLPWGVLLSLLHSFMPTFLSSVPDCIVSIFFRSAESSILCWSTSSSSLVTPSLAELDVAESLTPLRTADNSRWIARIGERRIVGVGWRGFIRARPWKEIRSGLAWEFPFTGFCLGLHNTKYVFLGKVAFQTCIDLAQDYSKFGIICSLDFVMAWHLWSHVLPVHNLFMEPWYCPVWFLSTLMIKRIFVGYLSTPPTGNSSHLGLTITPIAPLHL